MNESNIRVGLQHIMIHFFEIAVHYPPFFLHPLQTAEQLLSLQLATQNILSLLLPQDPAAGSTNAAMREPPVPPGPGLPVPPVPHGPGLPVPPAALQYRSQSPPIDDDLRSLLCGTSSSYSCSAGQQKVVKTTPSFQQLNDIKTVAKKLFELNYPEVTAYNKASEEDIEGFHTSLSEALPKFSFSAKTWCEVDYVVQKSVAARNFMKCNNSLGSSSHKH